MAECRSTVGGVLNKREKQREEEARNPTTGNGFAATGRRPLSDSSIKYEENAFQDSSDVILVNFGERGRNPLTLGNSDGDTSDDIDGGGISDSRPTLACSSKSAHSFHTRSRKLKKSAFVCDCQQSQKSKRKAASKLVAVSSVVGFAMPVSANGDESGNRASQRRDSSFINRVKKWFGDSGSPTNCDGNEPRWPKSLASSSKTKGTDTVTNSTFSRSSKKELQKKERYYIIADILALTNCAYYWGSINRHEAEELLLGKSDGTFLLRDSAHKEHLFSVSFRRYNKTLHARIEQWDHKYSFDRESPTAYYSMTIEGLLSHYSIGEYCMFFEPMLVKPLYRTQPQPLMSLCRGAIGTFSNYEDVEKLPLPSRLKTYLKEYNYCIKPKSKKDDPDGRRKRNSTLCIF